MYLSIYMLWLVVSTSVLHMLIRLRVLLLLLVL
jgi:hypothetical protein